MQWYIRTLRMRNSQLASRCWDFKDRSLQMSTAQRRTEKELCWKLFPNSARPHWLLQGHMISNNETVSRQNLWAGKIEKSMTSEGKNVLFPANFDRRPLLVQWISSFKHLICFPRDQSLSFHYNAANNFRSHSCLHTGFIFIFNPVVVNTMNGIGLTWKT